MPRPKARTRDLVRLLASRRILIKGAVILTLDKQVGDFANGDMLIEDGKIREVRPNIDVSAETVAVVDGTNRIVIPGFVDTHSHSYQGLLRGILIDGLLEPDYNRDVQRTLSPVYQTTDAYAGVLLTALGMIDAGTTGVVDISQVSHSPEHSDAVIQALRDSGIRAVYSFHRGSGPAAQFPQDIKRLAKVHFSSKDQLVTLALTTTVDPKMWMLAREVGVQAVQHIVGKDLSEPVLALGRAGLLRPGDEFIHCLTVNDEAWRLMKDSGGQISICAPIDMTMGHGVPAIQTALDHGFRPSLSSDHPCAIGTDFFTVMRTTSTLQRMQVLERKRAGEQNLPALLSCRDMLEFATISGARCANLDAKVRHAHAGQGSRPCRAQGRSARRVAAQQCGGHGRQPDESEPRRERLHRRQGKEMARQPGRRRCRARRTAGRGGARRRVQARRVPSRYARLTVERQDQDWLERQRGAEAGVGPHDRAAATADRGNSGTAPKLFHDRHVADGEAKRGKPGTGSGVRRFCSEAITKRRRRYDFDRAAWRVRGDTYSCLVDLRETGDCRQEVLVASRILANQHNAQNGVRSVRVVLKRGIPVVLRIMLAAGEKADIGRRPTECDS